MAPLAYLPHWLGALLWNLLNTSVLLWGIRALSSVNNRAKVLVLWFMLIELVTSLANAQSNALVVGLVLLGFADFERGKNSRAVLWIMLCAFIKIYGIAFLLLALFYPKKSRAACWTVLWGALLWALPLCVVPLRQLVALYESWQHQLASEQASMLGLSVAGVLHALFKVDPSKTLLTLIGVLILCLPLVRLKKDGSFDFRLGLLTSLLVWVTIFNHKAESPTYIIAVAGIALWFFTNPKSRVNLVLIVIAFVFTLLSPTDLFPGFIRRNYFVPYMVKAIPCILIWIAMSWDLMTKNFNAVPNNQGS